MTARTCEECGKSLAGRSPRTRFCDSACRGRANRRPGKVGQARSAATQPKKRVTKKAAAKAKAQDEAEPPEIPDAPTYDTLEDQVRQTLTELQALTTISGMNAVRVAQQIDRGGDTGSAVATLSKELSRLVAEAKVEAAPRIKDAVDDIQQRAADKMRGLLT